MKTKKIFLHKLIASVVTLIFVISFSEATQASTRPLTNPNSVSSASLLKNKLEKLGLKGLPEISSFADYDENGIPQKRNFKYRPNGELDRIDLFKGNEGSALLDSVTYFSGRKGRELPHHIFTFDCFGNAGFVYFITFEFRTLSRIDQMKLRGDRLLLISRTYFSGPANQENAYKILFYDLEGINVRSRIDCVYSSESALREIAERSGDNDTLPINKKTLFLGASGEEKMVTQFTYDRRGNIISQNDFFYTAEGDLVRSEMRQGNALMAMTLTNVTYYRDNRPSYSMTLDIYTGQCRTSTEYLYNEQGVLLGVQLHEGSLNVPVESVSSVERGESIHHTIAYDAKGNFQNRHDFSYDPNGKMAKIESRSVNDPSTLARTETVFSTEKEEGVNVPKYSVTYNSTGKVVARKEYAFSSSDQLEPVDSRDSQPSALLNSPGNTPLGNGSRDRFIFTPNQGQRLSIRRDFGYDVQGVLNQILVRAGPRGGLIS